MNMHRKSGYAISAILALAAVLILPGAFSGCGSLDPAGPYQGDKVVYDAEFTITTAYSVMHEFVLYEKQNREALSKWPEVKKAADYIRKNARQWNDSAVRLLEIYKAEPTDDTRDRLRQALSVMRTGMVEAMKYLGPPAEG